MGGGTTAGGGLSIDTTLSALLNEIHTTRYMLRFKASRTRVRSGGKGHLEKITALPLVCFKVEADFIVGLQMIVEAESYWHAAEVASKKWGVPHSHISSVLHN